MKTLPLNVGILHFIGIGGIGMSGIAEILHNLGYQVQGSDLSENANVERLRKLGITVLIGHKSENIENVSVVVKSSAVKDTNPEIIAAREKYIPIVRRAEMLAELMRLKASVAVAGTHGKTTTTSLVAALFEAAGQQPTVINGGIINTHGTNAWLGKGDWLIAEADESDGTFIKIPATVGIITNIEPEHLDHYQNFETLRAAFRTFLENLPFYGFALVCKDHPEVKALLSEVTERRLLTYGLTSDEVDLKAVNIRITPEGSLFDIEISERLKGGARVLKDVLLPIRGRHNISNSLSAIGIALDLGFPEESIRQGLISFKGVKRRFTKTGEVEGITIIDDYGHHPTEIAATLKTAREVVGDKGKVIAVVQPHRYSRVRDLFLKFCQCYGDADKVIIADIYSAGEEPIPGVNQAALVAEIQKLGAPPVIALPSSEHLAGVIAEQAQPGDIVVCLGAGSITYWANALPRELEAIKKKGDGSNAGAAVA